MSQNRSIRPLIAPLALAVLLESAPAGAAWDVLPMLTLGAESEDNARHLPGDQPTSTRAYLDARLRTGTFSERGEAYIEPRIVADAYADEPDRDLEHDDLFLRTHAARNLPRAFFTFDSDFRRQSVLRSEIDDALDDEIPLGADVIDTESGAIGTFTDVRDRFGLSLAGGHSLSDRTTLGFDTSWIDVAYDSDFILARSDFENTTLGMSLTRSVDERNDVSARIYAMDYSAPRNDNESHALGVEASFLRPLTGTVSFGINVGVVRTEFSYLVSDFTYLVGVDNGFTFGFDVEKQARATTLEFAAGRTVSPGTTGFLAPRDDLRFSVRHRFTPRFRLSGGLRAAEIDVGDGATIPPREYLRATIEMDWLFTERWSLLAGLDGVRERFGNADADIESNSVFVGVRYQGRPRADTATFLAPDEQSRARAAQERRPQIAEPTVDDGASRP